MPPPTWRDVSAADIHGLRESARERRGDDGFVIAVGGRERRDDVNVERAYVREIESAGADWWHEYVPPRLTLREARRRIESGPLRAD